MKDVKNGVIINGAVYEAVVVDDITAKCCKGCAFEHSNGECPGMWGKHIQRIGNVGVIFKKVESTILKTKSLDSDISKLVDDNFWNLV